MKALIKKAVGAAGFRISGKRDDQYDEDGLRSDHNHEFANVVTLNGSGECIAAGIAMPAAVHSITSSEHPRPKCSKRMSSP